MKTIGRVLAATAVAALAGSMLSGSANAVPMHRMHHASRALTVSPRLMPAHLRPGYVGAPGFAGGPPGPVMPTLIDFPQSGFFSPNGFITYGTGIGTDLIAGAPGLVTGAVGLGTGLATTAVGAGTGIVGAGVGYLPR